MSHDWSSMAADFERAAPTHAAATVQLVRRIAESGFADRVSGWTSTWSVCVVP